MTLEDSILARILRECSRGPVRLFRNSVAVGWVGQLVGHENGCVILRNARRNSFGLAVGSGDLIGYTIRDGVAVFTSLEVKTPTGRVRPEQVEWDAAIRRAGGISGVVRSVEEAKVALKI